MKKVFYPILILIGLLDLALGYGINKSTKIIRNSIVIEQPAEQPQAKTLINLKS